MSANEAPFRRRPPLAGHKTVYCIRHGQAEHNVSGDLTLRDPRLTALGRAQAALLPRAAVLLGRRVELVVSSPLRRTLETACLGFGGHSPRPIVIAHPDAQETGTHPSDTGSDAASLAAEFGADVDVSLCVDGWYRKLEPYDMHARRRNPAGCDALRSRLERLGAWLRARPERSIAIVAHHGVFAHLVGVEMELANCEVVECALDAAGWSVQRAASEVVPVLDRAGRLLTNYDGTALCATLCAVRSVHGKQALANSQRSWSARVAVAPDDGLVLVARARADVADEPPPPPPARRARLYATVLALSSLGPACRVALGLGMSLVAAMALASSRSLSDRVRRCQQR
jgi:broad specificity phosphatase PhoE